jgi:hypothetical protein
MSRLLGSKFPTSGTVTFAICGDFVSLEHPRNNTSINNTQGSIFQIVFHD